MNISIERLDKLFQSYNYQVSKQSNVKLRIYTLRYGMYHAAELIKLDKSIDVSKIKTEFSELGYATEVKDFSGEDEIEEYLFEGFFIKTPLGNELKRRYTHFVNRQLTNLPEQSTYKYIDSDFEILYQDANGEVIEKQSYNTEGGTSIIEKINSLISTASGAIFIIIEAAAGFGKTCTANEILNKFSTHQSNKLPFFTELSRNREARVFKHILLNEIDEQFPAGIKQNIVIEQITKGRIPLIIDGFDELISKESNKEEVESMLTTIVDLLRGDAKVIITSRKTAIFNSDEFLKVIEAATSSFSVARIEIKEPSLENWLSKDRVELIRSKGFPLSQLANPVLLSYLRNISLEKLDKYLSNNEQDTLVDKYVDYLLKREQVRQNLKLDNDTQLRVFRKLARFMTEYNFTAESKEILKDFLKDFNLTILKNSLNNYLAEEKPSVDDLVETLSNHVFLDRKPNGSIGFINDFIFGLMIGENLTLGKYEEHYLDYNLLIPQDFAIKSVQSFRIQNDEKKGKLWNIYNSEDKPFAYEQTFFFDLDYYFLNRFTRSYTNIFITDYSFKDIRFDGPAKFEGSGFSNSKFENCFFEMTIFKDCIFQNCTFYKCDFSPADGDTCFNDFATFACQDDENGFLDRISKLFEDPEEETSMNPVKVTDMIILRQFFNVDERKPRPRKISYIKENLSQYPSKDINAIISRLKSGEYLYFKDDVGFLSKLGITYFNLLKSTVI